MLSMPLFSLYDIPAKYANSSLELNQFPNCHLNKGSKSMPVSKVTAGLDGNCWVLTKWIAHSTVVSESLSHSGLDFSQQTSERSPQNRNGQTAMKRE